MKTQLPTDLTKSKSHSYLKYWLLPLGGLIMLAAIFVSGMYFEKALNSSSSIRVSGVSGAIGGLKASARVNRFVGQVESLNGQQFIVQELSGGSLTVQITSSTVFSDGATASDLTTGVAVIVNGQANSSGVIQASRISILSGSSNSLPNAVQSD